MSAPSQYEFGAGLWLFGQFIDRYATDAYGPPVGVLEAIDRAGQVGNLVALDINFPFDEGVSAADIAAALDRNGLRCHAITPASYSRKYRKGGLTNPDPALRRDCIELYKAAIPPARELGARYVKFWPGQDGYDYPFQADYEDLWKYSVDALRKIGWDEVVLLDQFPFREDPVRAARESIVTLRKLDALLDRLDVEALQEAQTRQDALAAQRLVLDLFLGNI